MVARAIIHTDLERDEGFIPHAYQDHLGFWTVGVGTLIDARRGGITKKQAYMLLDDEVDRIEADLDRRAPWWRRQPDEIQRAMVNMAYQLGVSGLLRFSKTLAKIQLRDYQGAATEALDSTWARQTPERAARISALIRSAPS
jgi:lysozyme